MSLSLDISRLPREIQIPFEQIARQFPLGPQHLSNYFIQLVSGAADRKMNVGTATLAWPGGSAVSTSLAVTHGLGTTPAGVVATAQDQGGTGLVAVSVIGTSATTFTLLGESPSGFAPPNTETTVVAWQAWT